jgi:Core-2/I-Branching enzyme
MRIAYLITAHDQPDHLHRMVKVLDCDGVSFYIHIDNKVKLSTFRPETLEKENVRFLKRRVDIQWMGFSMVESFLMLLQEASRQRFDYCVLLSGSDYPIKSNSFISKFFETSDKEFIAFWRLEDRPSWKHKIEYFYPIDLVPIYGHSRGIEKSYWRRLFWGRFFKYRWLMPKRSYFAGMIPYGGSDWWSLSYGCVAYVLRFVQENARFVSFYRYTHSPGEMFFQSIILNSEWARRVHNFDTYMEWRSVTSNEGKIKGNSMLTDDSFNLRYVDWSGEKTGQREAPAVLDERDWHNIRDSSDLFARKFHPIRSSKLLDLIDQELLGRSP